MWDQVSAKRLPLSFELELTARCNNNCRHCYINLPANDCEASAQEMSFQQIEAIADQAVEMGIIWLALTGGEPLLRSDFDEIYLMLKRKGFLINLFTNACLITDRHIQLFKKYPPRDIEVTVYGITKETYEAVSRVQGTYRAFRRGLEMLFSNGLPVTLKAMALKSNQHELKAISDFCSNQSYRPFRFDPVLHLRYDLNEYRNAEIKLERLEPDEVVTLEVSDKARFLSLQKNCDSLIKHETLDYHTCTNCLQQAGCDQYASFSKLFHCGIGKDEFSISYNGQLRLCSTLNAPGTTIDLHKTPLKQGLNDLKTNIYSTTTRSPAVLQSCKSCPITNLCLWCPATAYLETGDMEGEAAYFCSVAHARAEALQTSLAF